MSKVASTRWRAGWCFWLVALSGLAVSMPFALFWRGTIQSSGFLFAMTMAMHAEQYFGVLYPQMAAASAEYRAFYTVLLNSNPGTDNFHLGTFRFLTDGPVFGLSNMYGRVPGAESVAVEFNGNPLHRLITPDGYTGRRSLIYLHGGAFAAGSSESHESYVRDLAILLNAKALTVDYRLLPENTIHDSIADTLAGYEYLVRNGFPPEEMVFLGESAGAALSLLAIASLKQRGMALPAAAGLMSQGCCYEHLLSQAEYDNLPSIKTFNHTKDPIVRSLKQVGKLMDIIYEPRCQLVDTCQSLLADLSGFPPLFISVGGNEYLADVSDIMARNAKAAGVRVEFQRYALMPHVFQMFHRLLPEAQQSNAALVSFINDVLGER
eukprot:TRINITY_DN1306_c0_g1_i2.p1 TRINITY_DN1306_c0_g1~~TRINITY_DN1306_c0_g1_i2.p1  ORF type:complete len:379 (+),score=67.56 TRINITY_DN1306_c0_g1_i2:143-1279(+)